MTDEPTDEPATPPTSKRRRSTGRAIGGVLVGFDYQVFRASKPPAELVEQARPVRGVNGEDGSLLTLGFPDDDPPVSGPDPDLSPVDPALERPRPG
jgi:hypothetical protein